MSSVRDRERAERCFALARSTTFDGERESAIARGLAICAKADLDSDTFDIPGRAKRKPTMSGKRAGPMYGDGLDMRSHAQSYPRTAPSGRTFWSTSDKAPGSYSSADVREAMARFNAAMRDQAAGMSSAADAARRMRDAVDEMAACAADRGSGVGAAYEAGRFDASMRARGGVNLDDMAEATRKRQAQRARWPSPSDTASFLFSRGVPVYDMGDADDDGPRWFAPGRTPDRLDDDALRDLADEVEA